ncbi:MAG: hypothetical protein M3N57_03210, partial [Actinomycetota bacterium]|nr:hypothetical protein [Actinomycetota bacterium]
MVATWDRRTPAERDRVRAMVLEGWIPAVASFSPFWGRYLDRAGVDPARVRSRADLETIPPVREANVVGAGGPGSPALVLRPTEEQVKAGATFGTLLQVARAIRRGGAAGKRMALLTEYKPIHLHPAGRDGQLTIAYTRTDLDRLHRTGARAAQVLGLGSDDYLVSAVPADGTLRFWGLYHLALGASLLAVHARGHGRPVDDTVWAFRQVPATAVAVPIADAVALAGVAADSGADLGNVATVVVVGVPPDDEQRRAVADAWRAAGSAPTVRVLALWASAGGRSLWAECAEAGGATGLHTYPDLEVLEVLDPATGRTSDGAGDLTYTSAGWHGTGLIRYRTGDRVAGVDETVCSGCGRTVPRVLGAVTEAAWQPRLATPAGSERIDVRGAGAVLSGDDRVNAWQVELRGATARRTGDAYVVHLSTSMQPQALVDLDR